MIFKGWVRPLFPPLGLAAGVPLGYCFYLLKIIGYVHFFDSKRGIL